MTVPPYEIPGFGKGTLPPSAHEAESFLEEVEDVTRLVDGLRSGKVSAEYVDRVLREKDEETAKSETRAKQAAEEAEKNKYENLSEEKKTEVREKVAEMMREKERRERARELYAKYQEEKMDLSGSDPAISVAAKKQTATDYTSWDLWTPSDDEDDPWMKYMPDNPAFKAMEADIDKRHERQIAQRQAAHRAREAGNAAFKAGQFAEALKTYEHGLESDKRSIELHGNAAMAALKLGCFAQTIEHCDRANELAEFFLERPNHPTAIKCLLRRAAARDALAHFAEAVADLEKAERLDPGDEVTGEIATKLAAARRRREDAKAERALKRRLRDAKAATSRDGDGDGDVDVDVDGSEEDAFAQTVRLEKLMRRVGGTGGTSEDDGFVDYDAMEALLAKHESCRLYARGGGGVGIGKLASRLSNPPDARVGIGAAKALAAACVDEANCECLVSVPERVTAVARFASSSKWRTGTDALDASFHALEALRECSRHLGPRSAVVAAFKRLASEDKSSSREPNGAGSSTRAFGALQDQLRLPVDRDVDVDEDEDASDETKKSAKKKAARARNARCALAVFGNLALDPGARALARRDFSTSETSTSVTTVTEKEEDAFPHVIGRWIGSPFGDAETTRLAAAAIGNGCADPAWRAACVSGVHGASLCQRLFDALPAGPSRNRPRDAVPVGLGLGLAARRDARDGADARETPSGAKKNDPADAATEGLSRLETAASVLAALSNVLLEPRARAWVRGHADQAVQKLLPWLFAHTTTTDDRIAETEASATAASRAAATLSRCAREREVILALRSDRGAGGASTVARFVAATAHRVLSMDASESPSFAAESAALDGGTRALALVASFADAFATDAKEGDRLEASVLASTLADATASSLAACVSSSAVSDGVVGNAALALGDFARFDSLFSSLEKTEPALVPCLLAACRERKGAAQKNAAIACARLARHAPFMASLKEHHGLELIYSYVKP
uniref:Uncharacterized protein n=1 Tax=Micromonas pusilla TaxID=38833 RepID=A0A6U0DLZ5_MICPS|mmetsp:Transcript_8534/g.36151  ORF Transcript_8534/g.36151 Transcript_8534/m.36151 type:complete len:976 (-) Transcript_8534:57-2984(-)